MAIKVTVGEPQTQEQKTFPKLMTNQEGHIFFFVRKNYGLPLTGTGWGYSLSDFANWEGTQYQFKDYEGGQITLQNA